MTTEPSPQLVPKKSKNMLTEQKEVGELLNKTEASKDSPPETTTPINSKQNKDSKDPSKELY